MNLFIHYGYYEEGFEKDIVHRLLNNENVEKIVIPRGNKWKGVIRSENIVYIPSVPDFVESYDINKLSPLPRRIVEEFAQYESIALNMLVRESFNNVLNYSDAKDILLKYMIFWHHFMVEEKIDFFFARYVGQYLFEYVMYAMAKTLGIPTIVCYGKRWGDSIENIGLSVAEKYEEIIRSDRTEICLCEEDEKYYVKHRYGGNKKELVNSISFRKDYLDCLKTAKRSFSVGTVIHSYLSCGKYIYEGLKRTDKVYIDFGKEKISFNNRFWIRTFLEYSKAKKNKYYNRIATVPDYRKKYIYCALQTIPEIALTPLAGNYDNQMLEVHMLAQCAKEFGIEVYVKEHIYQHWREKKFYNQLRRFENVRLIKTTVNTYDLIENAVATATFTGSCAIEGVLRNIPALVFAKNEWRGLPGSFYITSYDDCHKALDDILEGRYEITDRSVRAFLKARELTALDTNRCLGNDYSNQSESEYLASVDKHVQFILERIKDLEK